MQSIIHEKETMETELISDYTGYLRSKGMAAVTREEYRANLAAFAPWLESRGVHSFFAAERDTIKRYYAELAMRDYAANTVYKKQHAVYAFYEWLKLSGRLLINPAPVAVFKQRTRPLPRNVPRWRTIQRPCSRLRENWRPWVQRDYVMIDLAYSCGLRRCELVRLNIEDIREQESVLRVRGKGARERLVPIGKKTLADLLYYVYRVRPYFIKQSRTNAVFVSWFKGGKRMVPRSVNKAFRDLHKRYGLPRAVTPHALRHAFATDMLRSGAPVQEVSKMLGHARLETTQIYTRMLPLDVKKHHAKYHPRG
jgi:site-specific recombinase XerD